MTNEYRETLSDVDVILNELTESEINRIPRKLRKFIKDNKIKGYVSSIRTDKPLEEQELTTSTQAFLAMLYYNYWCKNEEEKKELVERLFENERKHQEELSEKYNVDSIFKNNMENQIKKYSEYSKEYNKKNNTDVEIVGQKESVLKRIINKIMGLIKK